MVISNLQGVSFHAVVVFSLEPHFLFKSILAHGEECCFRNDFNTHNVQLGLRMGSLGISTFTVFPHVVSAEIILF